MSTAYEMISESLNEIIKDLEENNGKNLKRETLSAEIQKKKTIPIKKVIKQDSINKFFEPLTSY